MLMLYNITGDFKSALMSGAKNAMMALIGKTHGEVVRGGAPWARPIEDDDRMLLQSLGVGAAVRRYRITHTHARPPFVLVVGANNGGCLERTEALAVACVYVALAMQAGRPPMQEVNMSFTTESAVIEFQHLIRAVFERLERVIG